MAKTSLLSRYLKEIIYGGNDGTVTTFAVVAGFVGAQAQNMTTIPLLTVLLFGFANLFSDGVSMALGNFLSSRSEQDVYAREKKVKLLLLKKQEADQEAKTLSILINEGFSQEQAKTLTTLYKSNESYWLDFMMDHELQIPNPEKQNVFSMALVTFLAFIIFGVIPLLPYVFFRTHEKVFLFSFLCTGLALLILGLLRWRVTRHPLGRSLLETLVLGGAAAFVAYIVGTQIH
ncbi:MAG: VIT1/CCC1 transporter family protein [Candidatus Woesebacteria bacterium]